MKFELNEKTYYEELEKEMSIDSVTGQYIEMQNYLLKVIAELGFNSKTLHKGGIIVDAGGEGNMVVWLDGDPMALISLEATGGMSIWKTQSFPVNIPSGKHSLRVEMQEGVINLAWLQIIK